MAFKPIEPIRDEFRRYLESCGAIDAISKVFSKLLAEGQEPEEPLQYLKSNLSGAILQNHKIEHLNAELKEAKERVEKLKKYLDAKKVQS